MAAVLQGRKNPPVDLGGRKELIDRLEQDRVKVTNACKDIVCYQKGALLCDAFEQT